MKIVLYNEFDEVCNLCYHIISCDVNAFSDDLRNDASDKRTQHLHRKMTTDHITTYNIPESNFLEDASLSCFDKELCYCSKNFV